MIKLKGILMEDFLQYKKPCMTLQFPTCSFKCDKDAGEPVCQNSELASAPSIEYSINSICNAYQNNNITTAICCQGMEPFDNWDELFTFIETARNTYKITDDIVVYTGYNKSEITEKITTLKQFKNIIVKFGRFIPNRPHRYDEVLGVELASDNQYGERI